MNLNQKLSKKLKKTGGFTLIEMLIVVAIIAILVAVSIPLVSASLDKARTATDDANVRAAKAAALAEYMLSETEVAPDTTGGDTVTYVYNAETGKALKQTDGTNITGYNQKEQNKQKAGDGCVKVEITISTGDAVTSWIAAIPSKP